MSAAISVAVYSGLPLAQKKIREAISSKKAIETRPYRFQASSSPIPPSRQPVMPPFFEKPIVKEMTGLGIATVMATFAEGYIGLGAVFGFWGYRENGVWNDKTSTIKTRASALLTENKRIIKDVFGREGFKYVASSVPYIACFTVGETLLKPILGQILPEKYVGYGATIGSGLVAGLFGSYNETYAAQRARGMTGSLSLIPQGVGVTSARECVYSMVILKGGEASESIITSLAGEKAAKNPVLKYVTQASLGLIAAVTTHPLHLNAVASRLLGKPVPLLPFLQELTWTTVREKFVPRALRISVSSIAFGETYRLCKTALGVTD